MGKRILLQGITEDSHLSAISNVLSIPNPERIVLSAAFLNRYGLLALRNSLEPVAKQTTIITGIRNGITSAQGLLTSLRIGCATYAVDTGTPSILFHPKIYYSCNSEEARLIVGSANLTAGGIASNIEGSLFMNLDLSNQSDATFFADIDYKIGMLLKNYPDHVFLISDEESVAKLLQLNIVVDESERHPTIPHHHLANRPPISLNYNSQHSSQITSPSLQTISTPQNSRHYPYLSPLLSSNNIWQSPPLTRRDLCIPTGPNTNPTGSMLLKKGRMEGIDQRHYFRDVFFSKLEWVHDASPKEHIFRAQAQFDIIINGVSCGIYTLQLSHNSRTDTKSYTQNNSMTQIHWGAAKELVSREELLGKTLTIHPDNKSPHFFTIVIN